MGFKRRMAVSGVMAAYALCLASCSEAATSTSDETSQDAALASKDVAPASQPGLDPAILAASQGSLEAFVRAVVDLYKEGNVAPDMLPDNQAFFSTSTKQLIGRVTANDGMPFGADPFCDCQDWMSLKVISAKASMMDETHASVDLVMGGDRNLSQRYQLIKESEGWRISDIMHPEYGSMVARLESMA
ncbi:DUF3828 domain-containing protein [Blastomonas sp.]|uniref:DUF3828 domain-containing protein n=1 Tax=Blastomonas sp. TaxID=1909299 RepID=UPI00391C771F